MGTSNINTKWRVSIVDIPANSVKDILFANQMPNAFYISNNNDADLYISLTNTPTRERHDLRLKRYDSDVFGRPIPTNRMFILNDSNKKISVSVYSAENMFDMSVLKNFNVAIEEAALQAIAYDGIIRGVASGVKLPVDATLTIPPDLKVQATFPENFSVGISGAGLTHLANTVTEIQKLSGGQTLTVLLNELKNIKSAVEKGGGVATSAKGGTVTTASDVVFNFSEIDFLTNDAESDLTVTITFASGTTTAVLKSGDSLNDVKLKGSKIGFASSGTINARYLLLG